MNIFGGNHEIFTRYGAPNQLNKLKEETAELTEAIDIYQQCPSSSAWDHVEEEFADVCVVGLQFIQSGNVDPNHIVQIMGEKIQRQLDRIANGKEK